MSDFAERRQAAPEWNAYSEAISDVSEIIAEMIEQRRQRLEPVTAMPQIDVLRELQARIDWENQR